jgi:hypothetical protein
MQEPAPQTQPLPAWTLARWAAVATARAVLDPAAGPGAHGSGSSLRRVARPDHGRDHRRAAALDGARQRSAVHHRVAVRLLLDPPVRWLVRRGIRRTFASSSSTWSGSRRSSPFLALTLAPLLNEILRFITDFPKLAADLDTQLKRLGDFYAHLQIPVAIRDWIDGVIAGFGQGGSSGVGLDLSFLLPGPDRRQ